LLKTFARSSGHSDTESGRSRRRLDGGTRSIRRMSTHDQSCSPGDLGLSSIPETCFDTGCRFEARSSRGAAPASRPGDERARRSTRSRSGCVIAPPRWAALRLQPECTGRRRPLDSSPCAAERARNRTRAGRTVPGCNPRRELRSSPGKASTSRRRRGPCPQGVAAAARRPAKRHRRSPRRPSPPPRPRQAPSSRTRPRPSTNRGDRGRPAESAGTRPRTPRTTATTTTKAS
jgi:hypothetical protein